MSPLLIGSAGVSLLLIAFGLNLFRLLSERSRFYLAMNFAGAAMACWYAWQGEVIPFVILEGAWGLVALVRLLAAAGNNPRPATGR